MDSEALAKENLDYFSSYLSSLGVEGNAVLAQLSSEYDASALQKIATDPDMYSSLAQLAQEYKVNNLAENKVDNDTSDGEEAV